MSESSYPDQLLNVTGLLGVQKLCMMILSRCAMVKLYVCISDVFQMSLIVANYIIVCSNYSNEWTDVLF